METLQIGLHRYHKEEPTLATIEKAINEVVLRQREGIKKEKIALALSLLLSGNDMYKNQLAEEDSDLLTVAFSKELLEQVRKLSLSASYIKAIEYIAARE